MNLSRCEVAFGKNNIDILKNKSVMVVGVGGVGGYVAEMLARTGVGKLGLVDFDNVEPSNLNRQIIATVSNLGKNKADAMSQRLLDINPNLKICVFKTRLTKENLTSFCLKDYDYVVDAIDIVENKVDLIEFCHNNNINIVSAMGAGNKTDIPQYVVADIYKTEYDKLAKIMRKKLKEKNIAKHTVVFSRQQPQVNNENVIGSVVYHPAMCACTISAFVINELIKQHWKFEASLNFVLLQAKSLLAFAKQCI